MQARPGLVNFDTSAMYVALSLAADQPYLFEVLYAQIPLPPSLDSEHGASAPRGTLRISPGVKPQ